MTEHLESTIQDICQKSGNDRGRLMDIVRDVQAQIGCVSGEAMEQISKVCSCTRVEVESVVSFYSFLSEKPKGKIVVRLCNDPIDRMFGGDVVAKALSDELGIKFGETTDCGLVTLEYTPCIGMCDQAPAVLVNDVVVTNLTFDKVGPLVRKIMTEKSTDSLVTEYGDGNNGHELVKAMVVNNIVKPGEVIFDAAAVSGKGLEKALELDGPAVIEIVKDSGVKGRGGAGFPTGLKWGFTRAAQGDKKYIMCNADEGEPGTFKDRVLLTEKADMTFEGMTIGGHAIGSDEGILYLRAEYAYLREFLEKVLADRRSNNLLGKNILGKGFDFDIRIQMGAGAYICGEESSLISSCEGLRGDPKTRPPFPAQKGYNKKPTSVNNVETLCQVTRVLEMGAEWYKKLGNEKSNGTKIISLSGDCEKPGIYELQFGTTLNEVFEMAGAKDVEMALMAGPSGQFLSSEDFDRCVCCHDLMTGGALMVFNKQRDILEIAEDYMEFFIEESCGYCTPCRVGNVLLKERLAVIRDGKGTPEDLDYLAELGETVKATSRCGLGQSSPHPVLSSLKNFRSLYEAKVKKDSDGFVRSFDIRAQLSDCEGLAGRKSNKFTD